ncbi:haloacid dehalogenase hydrolase domain-containing protein 3 [Spatholobus suberectus]|nr:haloacid dehalogenase hydrolase domain-containing protein 3 [Spatholobus suberectus]
MHTHSKLTTVEQFHRADNKQFLIRSDPQYFKELHNYYMTDKAWHLNDPGPEEVFRALRKSGVKITVVSNFDTRLRPLLRALNCDNWFDAVAVSAKTFYWREYKVIITREE